MFVFSYQFKATELNPKILERKGLYGVKEAPVAPNTEQDPFNFRIEQRIKERKPQEEESKNEVYLPISTLIREGTKGTYK